ncbi:TPA: HNH endonuclease [Vibrio parahaemolyticus]|uniref:HNH endonuclease n=1 Tax=Vibrio parahaemolyticus TaxID=670 RepID=UPI002062E201|nr:HNH endonuclease signature motif containing protein [Vibrio parahaemolyticus]UPR05898.1 HNH endonuclease [Vibrio parahaemolyticus]HAV1378311.1 HNH endonuclease [Vibrio parahaemolyticus]HAV1409245.1 HNH endonuclease [Vibrio parahaemolyticus]HAV1465839.1 HNH endonuclease [Vibrio parahaemolyticus]HAV1529752.1 HNH endonuclease [Vibrio parahaemolyticus]
MSKILSKCHTFNFSESYAFADKVRKAIFESDYIIDPLDVASDLDNQITKPQKITLLHDYIDYLVTDHLTFYFRGGGWEYEDMAPILPMLESHQIEFLELDEYIKDWYRDDDTGETIEVTEDHIEMFKHQYAFEYIEPIVDKQFIPIIVTEVFSLLFADREAMKVFNLKVAESIGQRTQRNTYWPKWLERALFCREKGLCAICKSDLSSMFHTHGKLAIDHIVPIALNGVNDPTNLQILCQTCNGQKSGSSIKTSNAIPLFWDV